MTAGVIVSAVGFMPLSDWMRGGTGASMLGLSRAASFAAGIFLGVDLAVGDYPNAVGAAASVGDVLAYQHAANGHLFMVAAGLSVAGIFWAYMIGSLWEAPLSALHGGPAEVVRSRLPATARPEDVTVIVNRIIGKIRDAGLRDVGSLRAAVVGGPERRQVAGLGTVRLNGV